MHIFHSRENTTFYIFTGEKPSGWNYFFLFSQYCLREATLYGISVSFLRETPVIKKSESLISLIKERAFINSSATIRKSKQKLMYSGFASLYLKRLWEICR